MKVVLTQFFIQKRQIFKIMMNNFNNAFSRITVFMIKITSSKLVKFSSSMFC